jgi:hypothetical protein
MVYFAMNKWTRLSTLLSELEEGELVKNPSFKDIQETVRYKSKTEISKEEAMMLKLSEEEARMLKSFTSFSSLPDKRYKSRMSYLRSLPSRHCLRTLYPELMNWIDHEIAKTAPLRPRPFTVYMTAPDGSSWTSTWKEDGPHGPGPHLDLSAFQPVEPDFDALDFAEPDSESQKSFKFDLGAQTVAKPVTVAKPAYDAPTVVKPVHDAPKIAKPARDALKSFESESSESESESESVCGDDD